MLCISQKEKRRKWMFGRFRTKRLASITAPVPASSPPRDSTKSETEEEQEKHALTVAIATAAAAEAAVAAAQVAAEVVRLTAAGTPQSKQKCQGETEEETLEDVQPSSTDHERKIAATKIQATFRGYLVSFSFFHHQYLCNIQTRTVICNSPIP